MLHQESVVLDTVHPAGGVGPSVGHRVDNRPDDFVPGPPLQSGRVQARFRGGGEYFVRSFAKTNGYFTYGRIRNADGRWVIGEPGSDAGWHEGSEPSREGTVTFRFTKKEGSEAQGKDIAVSLYDHVKGDERSKAYLGEVAIWR
jgi:hypothetical protein